MRAVAPDRDLHLTADRVSRTRRETARALHGLAVEFQHHVAFLDAGLGGGTVLGDAGTSTPRSSFRLSALARSARYPAADSQIAAARSTVADLARARGTRVLRESGGRARLAASNAVPIPRLHFIDYTSTVVF